MSVKFNKDAMLKHRFWVIASLTILLTLGGLFYLALYGSEDANKKRSKYKTDLGQLKNAKGQSSSQVIEFYGKEVDKAKSNESTVWKDAYKAQDTLFIWPAEMEKKFEFLNGRFVTEIRISKLADERDWPPDSEFLMHGKLAVLENEWLEIKNRKGETVRMFRTPNPKITLADENKAIDWGNELINHNKQLFAVSYQSGRYFGDSLTDTERREFRLNYKAQVNEILKSVDPVDEKGNGVVQLRNWLYRPDKLPEDKERFIRFVTKDWNPRDDYSKEAWIAQENIWIQREIYRLIRAANDDISKFTMTSDAKKGSPYTFKNSYFEITLTLHGDKDNNKVTFKISNLLTRRQKLDLNFRVRMNMQGTDPEPVRISGLPLMPKGEKNDSHSQEIPYVKETELQRTGVYSVEQILTWETAAIKRIDHISIGSNEGVDISHSHRTYTLGLRPFDEKDKPKEEAGGKGPAAVGAPPPVGGVPGAGGGAGGNKTVLAHDLWTDRYTDVTEQSRRIPVAISLIVDQDHVNRVLTQFNNSKLRFVHSQVLLNHFAGSLQPALLAERKEAGAVGVAPMGIGPMGVGPMGVGPMGNVPGGGAGENETNIELVIYGVMTLYQRYPPRPAAEKRQ